LQICSSKLVPELLTQKYKCPSYTKFTKTQKRNENSKIEVKKKQTDRKTDRHTNRQTNGQTDMLTKNNTQTANKNKTNKQ